jgi:hypothetical protein
MPISSQASQVPEARHFNDHSSIVQVMLRIAPNCQESPPIAASLTVSEHPLLKQQFTGFQSSASRGSLNTLAHSFQPSLLGAVFHKLFIL